MQTSNLNRNLRILLGVIGVILLVYVLWNVRTIIYYFFTAVIIAFIGRPLMALLGQVHFKNWYLPNWLKSLVVLFTFLGILFGFFQMIIPKVISQANIISEIEPDALVEQLQPHIERTVGWLDKFDFNEKELEEMITTEVSKIFQVSEISSYFTNILSGLTDSLIALFSILFISFFLLKDGTIVDNVVESLTPDKYLEKIKAIFKQTKNLLSRYFIGVVLQILIIMTIISVGLGIVGVENAIIIGLVAGIFNIIPYLGPIIGGLIGMSLALTTQLQVVPDFDVSSFLFRVLSVFVVAQMVDNFVLQPLIFSKSVKAHPLEIFIVILAAGSLAGVVGMILAVPAYSFIRIVAKEFFNGYKVVQGLTKNI
ncbi:AI-2E family transporter [bacterium]|nr:AI-2E family transporter [bacterium]